MEPKNDNLLLLSRIDSAERLDTLVAQPLLASGRPKEAQMAISHGPEPPSAAEAFVSSYETLNPTPNGPIDAMEVQSHPANDSSNGGPQHAKPNRILTLEPVPPILEPVAALVAFVKEFPPLEKGKTLKIRDKFENESPHQGSGSLWSRPISCGQVLKGTGASEVGTLVVHTHQHAEKILGIEPCSRGTSLPSPVGQSVHTPKHAETFYGTRAGTPVRMRAENILGSEGATHGGHEPWGTHEQSEDHGGDDPRKARP